MRRYLLAMPVPDAPAYDRLVEDLRAWSPGLRAEPPHGWHLHLARLGDVDPQRVMRRVAREVAGMPAVPCAVGGIGVEPEARKAREVWAGVAAPGLAKVVLAALGAADAEDANPHRRVALAHLPGPTDVRSFLMAHEGAEFAAGELDRVQLLEAEAVAGNVRYRVAAEAALAPRAPAPPPAGLNGLPGLAAAWRPATAPACS